VGDLPDFCPSSQGLNAFPFPPQPWALVFEGEEEEGDVSWAAVK